MKSPCGATIGFENGEIQVPDNPIIPIIAGDGIGPEISTSMQRIVDAAVEKAYGGKKKIDWLPVDAGEAAMDAGKDALPQETLGAISKYRVAIKGPLTTPVGGGYRSLNVAIRQKLDLYACVRPIEYYDGLPSPVKRPDLMNVVVFRENTEDVYAGFEWAADTPECEKLRKFLKDEFGAEIREHSGLGIKPISVLGTERLVRKAILFAIKHKRASVTLVHKGNIMKFTEGAFRDWGYQLAKREFPDQLISEADLWEKHDGKVPEGKIIINDRIADNMLQQILTRTAEYDVLATPNLNGDYISDACAAQVGGLGMAPGANIGDGVAVFEATHGTAPKYVGKNVINPCSLILSAVMMLDHLGWIEAGEMIRTALSACFANKEVTQDITRQMEGVEPLGTIEFTDNLISRLS